MLNLTVKKKVWLEFEGKPILGKGRFLLLKTLKTTKSVKKSAKLCGLSEKTAHNHIKRIESRLNQNIVETKRGGKNAGWLEPRREKRLGREFASRTFKKRSERDR